MIIYKVNNISDEQPSYFARLSDAKAYAKQLAKDYSETHCWGYHFTFFVEKLEIINPTNRQNVVDLLENRNFVLDSEIVFECFGIGKND